MKPFLSLLTVIIVSAGTASANSLCTSDTIGNYVLNYSSFATACQVGDKLFYNFNYSGTSNGAPAPSSSQVFVAGDSSNPFEPGLIFTSNAWTVSGTSTFANPLYIDSNITFTVAVVGLKPLIIDASLDFDGHFSTTGEGVADIGETVTPGLSSSIGLEVDSENGPFTSVATFAPVSFLRVSKDLLVIVPPNVDVARGSATITQFREGFSEIAPEPLTTVLFGSGLVGLALLKRRRK